MIRGQVYETGCQRNESDLLGPGPALLGLGADVHRGAAGRSGIVIPVDNAERSGGPEDSVGLAQEDVGAFGGPEGSGW